MGGEILKKGVDQPFSHFIIPCYQGLFVETFYIKAPIERDRITFVDFIFSIQILIACLKIERFFQGDEIAVCVNISSKIFLVFKTKISDLIVGSLF